MHYVNARWLGGMLTNFRTIRKRIDRMAQLQNMKAVSYTHLPAAALAVSVLGGVLPTPPRGPRTPRAAAPVGLPAAGLDGP